MSVNGVIANPRKLKLIFAGLAAVGSLILFITIHKYGPSFGPTNTIFISVARNILAGKGITTLFNLPYVLVPPLYPVVIALISWVLSVDPEVVFKYLQVPLFGIVIYFAGVLSNHIFPTNPLFSLLFTLLALTSIPLFHSALYGQMELLFIDFLLLAIIYGFKYIDKPRLGYLIFLSGFISLACYTRYNGIAFIPWGLLVLFLAYRVNRGFNIYPHVFIYIVISCLPILIWLVRNYLICGDPFGQRRPSETSFFEVLKSIYNNYIYWYFPGIKRFSLFSSMLFLLMLLVFGILTIYRFREILAQLRPFTRPLVLLSSLIFIFFGVTVYAALVAEIEAVGGRLSWPIYIPLTLVLILVFRGFYLVYICYLPPIIVRSITFIGLTIMLLHPLRVNFLQGLDISRRGWGYNQPQWRFNKAVSYMKEHKDELTQYVVYSNDPVGLYRHLPFYKVQYHPMLDTANVKACWIGFNGYLLPYGTGRWPSDEKSLLVVFPDTLAMVPKGNINLDSLRLEAELETLAHFDDGTIYYVYRK